MTEALQTAFKAIQLYAESHPRPAHVNQRQAAEMLSIDPKTLRKMIKVGTIKLNRCGLIPVSEIDKVLSA